MSKRISVNMICPSRSIIKSTRKLRSVITMGVPNLFRTNDFQSTKDYVIGEWDGPTRRSCSGIFDTHKN